MTHDSLYKPSPDWLKLGEGYQDPVQPADFPQHILRYRNQTWAEKLGLDDLSDPEWIEHFGKFTPLAGNLQQPLALRYHGHQFTHYNPDLGDGRGFLFAQIREPQSGRLLDLGTKGSGQTPYSRRGDGRLTLKGAVREILATEMLESLGVNTSKTFSVIETGEDLIRNDEPSPTRSAVLVRLNHSHVRFGSFQRLAFEKDKTKMQKLLDYCLKNLYPKTQPEDFFVDVCSNVAQTTAQWMLHGFVHGVLNTDNMNITGESFDYGPYRFLPHYDPKFTAAYFDHNGLYAYGQQANMVMWNLERLKDALQLIVEDESFYLRGFEKFKDVFNEQTLKLFSQKLGLKFQGPFEDWHNLFFQCLQFLEESKAPYSEFFHDIYVWHQNLDKPLRDYRPEFYENPKLEELEKVLARFARDPHAPDRSVDDLETLVIDEIEEIWSAIDKNDNWQPLQNKIKKLQTAKRCQATF